jgi:GTP-binding protein
LEFLRWVATVGSPFVLVFTKADKLSTTSVEKNIAAFMKSLAGWWQELPGYITCSAKTKSGRDEILEVIAESLASKKAERSSEQIADE